ncbi:hypothetical protein J2Y48_000235 [Mycoplana sp. BE70]|nr:hypothetical protein [Mycoplana sp. BE70]
MARRTSLYGLMISPLRSNSQGTKRETTKNLIGHAGQEPDFSPFESATAVSERRDWAKRSCRVERGSRAVCLRLPSSCARTLRPPSLSAACSAPARRGLNSDPRTIRGPSAWHPLAPGDPRLKHSTPILRASIRNSICHSVGVRTSAYVIGGNVLSIVTMHRHDRKSLRDTHLLHHRMRLSSSVPRPLEHQLRKAIFSAARSS